MNEELVIEVTQAHIDNGVPKKADSCPLALALTDMGYYYVGVGYDTANGCNSKGEVRFNFDLSPEMSAFVRDFDSGGDLPAPVTFTISRWQQFPDELDINLTDDEWRNS